MKVREHAKQLPKELIKDITLKSAERSLLSTHDGSHFSPKQSPEQYASDRLEEGIKWSASKGETIVSQGSKKAAKKKAEKTWAEDMITTSSHAGSFTASRISR